MRSMLAYRELIIVLPMITGLKWPREVGSVAAYGARIHFNYPQK
jgi:hypothetical protein